MKKLAAIVLALTMVLALCACGGAPETPTTPTEPQQSNTGNTTPVG